MVAGQKGAKALALAFRVGKADDDDFLAVAAFDLEPAATAPGPIGCVAALRDDAFEAEAAGLAKNRRSLALLVVAVAQYTRSVLRNDVGECGLAVFERCPGKVPAVTIKEVEGEEIQPPSLAGGNRVLQAGKICCPIGGEVNELAVDQRSFDRKLSEDTREVGKLVGPVEPVAGDQPNLAALDIGEQAIAVIFDLVQPIRSCRRRSSRRRELRFQVDWPWAFAGTRDAVG